MHFSFIFVLLKVTERRRRSLVDGEFLFSENQKLKPRGSVRGNKREYQKYNIIEIFKERLMKHNCPVFSLDTINVAFLLMLLRTGSYTLTAAENPTEQSTTPSLKPQYVISAAWITTTTNLERCNLK